MAAPDQAFLISIEGAIGPATSAHVADGLERARQEDAAIVILEMDTPGGLDTSMREIIQEILSMPLPVVGYVHPSGARAASAGTYIIYASHVSAMTPGTNLGAATPIQIGSTPAQPEEGEEKAPQNVSEQKAVNDAVAYIRSLAEIRGRNADWAERAVRNAESLSASAALEQGVIEIVAADIEELLVELDGRTVDVAGESRKLSTKSLSIVQIEADWSTRLLATITDPNVALILLMVGIYGLFFEFMNPGALVPGTIGAISLLVALYSLAALPVDFAGIALILLGLALLVAEAFAPSFGILGLGGLASFVVGAAIMFDTDVPQFQVDRSVIAALGVLGAILMIIIARVGISSFRRPVKGGKEDMIGAKGEVADWHDGRGHVFVHSERWNATGPHDLEQGATVKVEGIDKLELSVSLSEEEDART
ncbi:nodulation protein NfeD [Erythrobacter sp.]|uniref:NfeD family protein n=1 Tax=Erythrobacter sp. TaxID=1042 RepID=UPI00311E7C43